MSSRKKNFSVLIVLSIYYIVIKREIYYDQHLLNSICNKKQMLLLNFVSLKSYMLVQIDDTLTILSININELKQFIFFYFVRKCRICNAQN